MTTTVGIASLTVLLARRRGASVTTDQPSRDSALEMMFLKDKQAFKGQLHEWARLSARDDVRAN